jgi:hypothetical protein
MFWDPVYVERYQDGTYNKQVGSKKATEVRGRFVGFSWDHGHALTFKILLDDTKQIIHRSRVRLAEEGERNLKLDAVLDKDVKKRVFIQSKRDDDLENPDFSLPTIDMSKDPFSIELEDAITPDEGETTGAEPAFKDRPVVETVDDEEDLPEHAKPQPLGRDNPEKKPRNFDGECLDTHNPTEQRKLKPEEMIDRTFLMPTEDDGTRHRAKIVERIELSEQERMKHPEMIKFRALVNDKYEEVVAYNDILDYIEDDEYFTDGLWKFEKILDHRGPFKPRDPRYRGSAYEVLLLWSTGEQTWEPIKNLKTDPITLAIYAKEKGLLNTEGWKHCKRYVRTEKGIERLIKQAKLKSFRHAPKYMYGILVPRNHQQAMEFDRQNGNTKWRDAEILELSQIDEYDTFIDKGEGFKPSSEYKKITVHMVYAVKHDGRHKARFVAGGHLTDTPIDSVYSSVVSLRGIRLLVFIAEEQGLEVWSTDIGNAYLESFTQEKVYIIAGPEFGDREGHTLIISKALYGLKSSGLRWSERFSDVLREMGFFPSKAERDIWMRDRGDHYEYIAVYVDDLMIIAKNCKDIIEALEGTYEFKLKGTGPTTFHLGCDFMRDSHGTLSYGPVKYIQKMVATYERLFGTKPKSYKSPLEQNDHPEMDTLRTFLISRR